jgi:hypothetical protein
MSLVGRGGSNWLQACMEHFAVLAFLFRRSSFVLHKGSVASTCFSDKTKGSSLFLILTATRYTLIHANIKKRTFGTQKCDYKWCHCKEQKLIITWHTLQVWDLCGNNLNSVALVRERTIPIRATAACRRSKRQLLLMQGCCVVSAADTICP